MPGLVGIVSDISDDVVAALAAAGYPALVDGKIVMGGHHLGQTRSPPRVVFVPSTASWGSKDVTNSRTTASQAEQRLEVQARSLMTEAHCFEIHVWGQATPANPDYDYDATQILYQQVIRSINLKAKGVTKISSGKWTDFSPGATKVVRRGCEFVFTAEFQTPLVDQIFPYAPSDVEADATTYLQPADGGTAGIGCSDS